MEDIGHYEENHMQLVPVGYFMDNGEDDSGNSQFCFLARGLFFTSLNQLFWAEDS